jgi:hypothetical protein
MLVLPGKFMLESIKAVSRCGANDASTKKGTNLFSAEFH